MFAADLICLIVCGVRSSYFIGVCFVFWCLVVSLLWCFACFVWFWLRFVVYLTLLVA